MAIELSEHYLSKKQVKTIVEDNSCYNETANCLNLADEVLLDVNNREYKGVVEIARIGEVVAFRVKNVDQNLLRIDHGLSVISLRVITHDKMVKEFPVKVITAKMPHILLTFPNVEREKVVRREERFSTNLDTVVTLYKRKHVILHGKNFDIGKVKNISVGGCSISVNLDFLMQDDKIEYYIQAVEDGEPRLLEMTGRVKNIQRKADGSFLIGVQHYNIDSSVEESLEAYIERRQELILGIAS